MTGEGYGAGLFEDLNAVQTILVDHLKNVRTEIFNGLAFKVYLEYECFLSRGPYTTEGGQVAGQDEERVFKLSSADKDHVVFTVRTSDQCTDAIGQSLSTIVELFNDIAVQGSGWIWNRSVGVDINVSKKVDRVPIKGPSSDRMIEKMEAQNRGKDTEKKEEEENPVAQGDPTHAGSYLSLPKWLRDAKKEDCFFNPKPYTRKQEDDNLCFSWCILRALHPDGLKDPSTNLFYPGFLRSGKNVQTQSRMGHGQMGNVADLAEGIRQGKISHIQLPEGVSYPVPLKESVFAQVEEQWYLALYIPHRVEEGGVFSVLRQSLHAGGEVTRSSRNLAGSASPPTAPPQRGSERCGHPERGEPQQPLCSGYQPSKVAWFRYICQEEAEKQGGQARRAMVQGGNALL